MRKTNRVLILTMLCICYAGWAIAGQTVRTIEIHAHRYAFTPSEITVRKERR
jgi:hypothetical protein